MKKVAKRASKKSKSAKSADDVAGRVVSIARKIFKDHPERAMRLADGPPLSEVRTWIPSTLSALDEILGGGAEAGGGWAVGRISEVYGPEGASKSELARCAIKGVQAIGGSAVLLEFEGSADEDDLLQKGIDPERLVILTPDTAEQGCAVLKKIVYGLVEDPPTNPVLLIWDSVAAAPSEEERDKDASAGTMPRKAAAMGRTARELMIKLPHANAHLMFINQERMPMNLTGPKAMFAQPETPGGKGIKYAASQRVRLQRVSTLKASIKGESAKTGYLIKATTQKCRLTPPHQSVTFVLDFREGISPALTMLQHLHDAKIVKRVQGKYRFPKTSGLPEAITLKAFRKAVQDGDFESRLWELYAPLAASANWINRETNDADASDEADDEADE